MLRTPRTNPEPPEPDPTAAARFEADRQRIAERREIERPARVVAIATGPALTNPAAAADCMCSCHPRPADTSLHDGGVHCPCQPRSEATRTARLAGLLELLNDPVNAQIEEGLGGQREAFRSAAARLGVDATLEVGACPVVISGELDGTAFHLRERRDEYRVVVDPTGNTMTDLHAFAPGAVLIAAGDVDELDSATPAALLEVAVEAVRTHLIRRGCGHDRNPDGARFCCDCGVILDG